MEEPTRGNGRGVRGRSCRRGRGHPLSRSRERWRVVGTRGGRASAALLRDPDAGGGAGRLPRRGGGGGPPPGRAGRSQGDRPGAQDGRGRGAAAPVRGRRGDGRGGRDGATVGRGGWGPGRV